MIRKAIFAAGLAAIAMASPASAQTLAEFTLGGVVFEFPLPEGFCLPEGRMAEASERLAQADTFNKTLVTFITCGDESFSQPYGSIKAPMRELDTEIDRAPFLKALEPSFGAQSKADLFPGVEGIAEDRLEAVTGREVNLDGKINPLGVDGMCAYLGGVLGVQSGTVQYRQAIAGCITVVGRKPMIVYSTGRGDKEGDVARHAHRTRVFAQTIRVKRR